MVLRWPLTKDGSPKSSTSLVAQNLEIAQLIYSVNDDNIAQTVGLLFIVCPQCKCFLEQGCWINQIIALIFTYKIRLSQRIPTESPAQVL